MTRDLPLVVSVDDHVVEPPDLWSNRLPARDRERGRHVVRGTCRTEYVTANTVKYHFGGDGPETDWWAYEDLRKPIPQVMACVGFDRAALTMEPIAYSEMRPGCHDPVARLADMDLNHTEMSLCFPTFPRFCGQTFLEAKDRDLAMSCVRAYNDWMIEEWCGGSGGRLLPLCIVPLWNPRAAADEVRRNAERGCRAVAFTELPANLGLPSIHDHRRHWDPFLAACDETGTVVCMHIGSSSRMPVTSPDAPEGVRMALTFANAQYSFVDWLMSGVLARFRNLKIAYSEGQIGWMPFVLERVDNVFRHSASWAGLDPSLTEPPSTYAAGRVFGCFFEDDFGIASRRAVGIERITFETDYPHQDGTWPHTRDILERIADRVEPDELYRIARGNALAMLGMAEPALGAAPAESAR
ncbi:amidohydrolase (plasmid) [Embleya sp. NBC_00888]|uniref:amidohydrolase family protein n=1 Tax=Embleya sp. NBC_00888 TaxID=2975960 RepID=UPI002F91873E|nr:amidohydrolase [Embleya sp. NBC_00888]